MTKVEKLELLNIFCKYCDKKYKYQKSKKKHEIICKKLLEKKITEKQELKKLEVYFDEWEKEVKNNEYYNEDMKNYLLNCKKDSTYKWSKLAIKNGISVKEIEKFIDYFYWETYDGYIIRTFNGFTAVGILEIPNDHGVSKEINPFKIFLCGHNENKTEVEEQVNVYLTLEELEDFGKCINICIKKFKEI